VILDELVDDLTRVNSKEIRVGKVTKHMNVNVGEFAVERVSLSKSEHYDMRRKNGKLVVYKGFNTDVPLTSFIERIEGVDRESLHKKIENKVQYIVAKEFDVAEDDVKLTFDLRAGCSTCTCSPGWLVELPEQHPINQLHNDYKYAYPRQYDMWITFNAGDGGGFDGES